MDTASIARARPGARWLDDARRDVGYVLRTLRRSPVFTIAVVTMLATGIGANATLFMLADAVVFRPYPFARPDRLVIAGEQLTDARAEVSYPNFLDWQARLRAFDGLAAMGLSNWTMTVRRGEPRAVVYRAVSGTWFDVLGVSPMLGRTIQPADDQRGAAAALVLGYGLWQREFGGRPDVIGQPVRLDDTPFTVVGVMPREFGYPAGAEAWTALVPRLEAIRSPGLPDFLRVRGAGVLHVVGRLREQVTVAEARRELDAVVKELARIDGARGPTRGRVTLLLDDVLGGSRAGLLTLMAAVALLLLATLANVAGLTLIRASRRRNELAIRRALGASGPALARQLLWESGFLALMASVAGLAVSRLVLPLLLEYVPDIPRIQEARVDLRVAVVTGAAGLLAALVCWAAPLAALVRERGLGPAQASRAVTRGHALGSPRGLLVMVEIAVTVILLAGAGLLVRSVSRMSAVDLGFEVSDLLTVRVERPSALGASHDAVVGFYERAMASLRDLPGVEAVGAAGSRPLKGPIGLDSGWQSAGQSREASRANPWVNVEAITPGYFEAMRARVVEGRVFDDRDRASSEPVVIVSDSLARRAWPGESAVGKRLRTAATDRNNADTWCTVVGVVGEMRYRALGAASLDVYAPASQIAFAAEDIMVRARGAAETVAPLVRARLREVSPGGVITIDAMADALAAYERPWRSSLALFAVFAALTLIVSVVGVYVVLAASVSERVREIGIRLTLGASPGEILSEVLRSGAVLAAGGAALGVVASLLLAGWMRALLFEVSPRDALALSAAPLIAGLMAVTACAIPALRASRVDPIITLRAE